MAEKVTSMRLSEEDLEQFKAFAKENNLNQQQAFNSLIALAELEKAKGVLGDRAKSIDTFRDTINRAIGMYVNALEENSTAEHTIREELSKELSTKDNTISNLYEQLQEVKVDNETLKGNEKIKDTIIKHADEEVKKLQKDIEDKNKNIDKLNSNNDLLQEQLQEYKQYKEQYRALEKELEELKTTNINKDNIISSLDNSNKQLNDKIKNDAEMLDFYKSNISELKDNIKALEQQHKQELQAVKAEHEKILEKELNANTEQLKGKHDVEIAKKDLQIQKLQNEIEQLNAKSHRQVNNKTK